MSLGAWFWLSSHYPLLECPRPAGEISPPVPQVPEIKQDRRKLSPGDISRIKQLRAEGVILKDIAKQFGVSVPAIHHIVKGRKR